MTAHQDDCKLPLKHVLQMVEQLFLWRKIPYFRGFLLMRLPYRMQLTLLIDTPSLRSSACLGCLALVFNLCQMPISKKCGRKLQHLLYVTLYPINLTGIFCIYDISTSLLWEKTSLMFYWGSMFFQLHASLTELVFFFTASLLDDHVKFWEDLWFSNGDEFYHP